MKLRKSDIGKLVALEVLDHADQVDEPMLTECCGWLKSLTPTSAVLEFWRTPSDPGPHAGATHMAIVRASILSVKAYG